MTWDSDCGPTGRGATGSRRGDGRRADPDGDAPWGDSHTPSASVRTVRSSDEASRESCETGRIHAQPACACAPNHRRGPGGLQDRRRLAGPTAHAPRPRTSPSRPYTQIRGKHAARSQAPAAEEMKPGARLRTAQPTFRTGNEGSKAGHSVQELDATRLHGYTQAIPVQL